MNAYTDKLIKSTNQQMMRKAFGRAASKLLPVPDNKFDGLLDRLDQAENDQSEIAHN